MSNFLLITPYQDTYLNFLNGKIENRYKKFENDYWAISLGELIKNANFKTNKVIKFGTCGFIDEAPKPYLNKRLDLNYKFVPPNKADYIIMINTLSTDVSIKSSCFSVIAIPKFATTF